MGDLVRRAVVVFNAECEDSHFAHTKGLSVEEQFEK